MVSICWLGLTILLGAEADRVSGVVWTMDGQQYQGELVLGSAGLQVARAEGQPIQVPFTRLDRALLSLGPDLAQFGPLQGGWVGQDVGPVDVAGWAGQAGSAFALRVVGNGSEESTEAFHLVHQQAQGNAELVARLLRINGPDRHTRASVTVRESLAAGSPLALVGVSAGGPLCFQARSEWGKKTRTLALAQLSLPLWLRLVKQGAQCTGYFSTDGRQWNLAASTNLVMGERFYVGLALSAHGAFNVAQAQFDQVHLMVSGLRGEYFADPHFGTVACVRVDAPLQFAWGHRPPVESVPADRFSVRWTGQIEPEESGDYTFHLDTDGVARLWIGGQLVVVHQPGRTRSSASSTQPSTVRLHAGQRYDLRLEYEKTGGPGSVCLAWTTPRRQRRVVPAERLYCVPEFRAQPGSAIASPPNSSIGTAKGVWLCTGSFLAGQVRALDARQIKLAFRGGQELAVPTSKAAQVVLQVIAQATSPHPTRPGALLRNGDLIEGVFRRIEGRHVQLSSVLFGLRTLSLENVAVLCLRPAVPSPATFEVRTLEGSVLRADSLRADPMGLQVDEPAVGSVRLPLSALAEIRRITR
jgi:hypothetical protein